MFCLYIEEEIAREFQFCFETYVSMVQAVIECCLLLECAKLMESNQAEDMSG
jgi:hypothetical protein